MVWLEKWVVEEEKEQGDGFIKVVAGRKMRAGLM